MLNVSTGRERCGLRGLLISRVGLDRLVQAKGIFCACKAVVTGATRGPLRVLQAFWLLQLLRLDYQLILWCAEITGVLVTQYCMLQ